ncbi:AbrB/MazE/SpoVT family DNA-binding domain-containing protein [Candidatus Micrarchaeota archaeon]|nr:AbrB/MazE/SpoVT family DNA-binding domain-containing protein [Candidatus Micrarchaeota archaeon]
MKFEGKTCGVCNKGTLKAFKDEIAEGVYVDGYKDEYGHVAYSKEVMAMVEKIYRNTAEERSLVRVGSSVAVPIPASIVRLLALKPKEKVYVTTQDNRIIIRPSPF